MDDMIYAMQDKEMYEMLSKEAGAAFDDLEYDFCNSAESALGKFSAKSDENLSALLSQFSGSLEDNIRDIENRRESYAYNSSLENAVEDFLDDNCSADELLAICKKLKVNVDKPYLIYVQNGEYRECYDKSQLVSEWKEMSGRYNGICAVLYSVNGTEYQGILDEKTDILKQLNQKENIANKKISEHER